jgi:hypothetical protein
MSDSYTVLWSRAQVQLFQKYNPHGGHLEVMFGGPHTPEPSFRRFGVQSGDFIYPLWVYQGVVHALGRMRVKRLISLEEYFDQYPELFAGCEPGAYPMETFENYLKVHPERRFLAPTCTEEVAIGEDGTPIRLNLTIPPDLLKRLRFRSRRGERGLKHIENGKLTHTISLQGGVYRLHEESAREMERLVLAGRAESGESEASPVIARQWRRFTITTK